MNHIFYYDVKSTIVWAFDHLNIQKPKLMRVVGTAASKLMEQFTPQQLLTFLAAYDQAGGKDESWAKAVASPRERKVCIPKYGPRRESEHAGASHEPEEQQWHLHSCGYIPIQVGHGTVGCIIRIGCVHVATS